MRTQGAHIHTHAEKIRSYAYCIDMQSRPIASPIMISKLFHDWSLAPKMTQFAMPHIQYMFDVALESLE